jgi:hypothetical protein
MVVGYCMDLGRGGFDYVTNTLCNLYQNLSINGLSGIAESCKDLGMRRGSASMFLLSSAAVVAFTVIKKQRKNRNDMYIPELETMKYSINTVRTNLYSLAHRLFRTDV